MGSTLSCAAEVSDDSCGEVKHVKVARCSLQPLLPIKPNHWVNEEAALLDSHIFAQQLHREPSESISYEQQDAPSPRNAPPVRNTLPQVSLKTADETSAVPDAPSKVQPQAAAVKPKVKTKAGARRLQSPRQPGAASKSRGKREPGATIIGKEKKMKGSNARSPATISQEAAKGTGNRDWDKKQLNEARNNDVSQSRLEEIEETRLLSAAEREDEERQLEMGKHVQKAGLRSSLLGWKTKQAPVVEVDPDQPLQAGARHFVKKTPMFPPWPTGLQEAMFGMGCFWCAKSVFMKVKGVFSTQVGFAGGKMIQPTYDDVSLDASFAKTDQTGKKDHAEVVRIVFNPAEISYDGLLKVFWERHDPTQGNKQGRDEGYQYRSFIGCYGSAQKAAATLSLEDFQLCLRQKGIFRKISTEIRCPAPHFWYAEEVHQQYDAKPNSRPYCGLSPTGARLS